MKTNSKKEMEGREEEGREGRHAGPEAHERKKPHCPHRKPQWEVQEGKSGPCGFTFCDLGCLVKITNPVLAPRLPESLILSADP